MAEKPRFRQRTVFAKNLGFGVGFGYRNNTTLKEKSSLHLSRTMSLKQKSDDVNMHLTKAGQHLWYWHCGAGAK